MSKNLTSSQKTYKDLANSLVDNLYEDRILWQAPISPFYVVLRGVKVKGTQKSIKEASIRIIKDVKPEAPAGKGRYIFEIMHPTDSWFWFTDTLDIDELAADLERVTKRMMADDLTMRELYVNENSNQTKPTYQDLANKFSGDFINGSVAGASNSSGVTVLRGENVQDDVTADVILQSNRYIVRVCDTNICGPRSCTETLDKAELAQKLQMLTRYYKQRREKRGIKQIELYEPVLTYEDLAETIINKQSYNDQTCYRFFVLEGVEGSKDVRVRFEKDVQQQLIICLFENGVLSKTVSAGHGDKKELIRVLEHMAAEYADNASVNGWQAFEWYARTDT